MNKIQYLFELFGEFYMFVKREQRMKLHPHYDLYVACENLYPHKKKNILEKFFESKLQSKND